MSPRVSEELVSVTLSRLVTENAILRRAIDEKDALIAAAWEFIENTEA